MKNINQPFIKILFLLNIKLEMEILQVLFQKLNYYRFDEGCIIQFFYIIINLSEST